MRGDTVMAGYWRDPEATAATVRGGWLFTGDMGSMDADGFLTLKDRSKDLVISGGSNIYPREVEEVLLLAPGVAEVVGGGRARSRMGRSGGGLRGAASGTSRSTPPRWTRCCLERIARFKRPKRYVVVEALPKNNYGKVLRPSCARACARLELPAVVPISAGAGHSRVAGQRAHVER